MDILKAENISFGYNSKKQVLENINFEMGNDEIVGLFGDSGSGKSTFCKVLTGFIDSYDGNVSINGGNTLKNNFNMVQLIYQHPEKIMNPRWNMGDILQESWCPSNKILDEFGIKEEWLKRYPSELSGGELQRFSILRALNPSTKFIVADEITTMLDAVTQVQIWDSLIKYSKRQDIGILVVSHDYNLLKKITDRIVLLDELNNE